MIRKLVHSFYAATRQCLNRPQTVFIWNGSVFRSFCSTVDLDPDHESESPVKQNPVKTRRLDEYRQEIGEKFLSNLSPELVEKKKRIELECRILAEEQQMVPENISAYQWKYLLTNCKGRQSIASYLRYLALTEFSKKNDKVKREITRVKPQDSKTVLECLQFSVHLISRERLLKLYAGIRSMVNGHPIIVDFDYDTSEREQKESFKQLLHLYGENLKLEDPMHIYLTGITKNHRIVELIETGQENSYMMDFHSQSFYEVFPKEQLVMLSPDAPKLKEYNGNDIYVIGGLVDIHQQHPRASFSKAKKLGIRCGSLPITDFCKRSTGAPGVLTLDCMFRIMAGMHANCNWQQAFKKNLPSSFSVIEESSNMTGRFIKTGQSNSESLGIQDLKESSENSSRSVKKERQKFDRMHALFDKVIKEH